MRPPFVTKQHPPHLENPGSATGGGGVTLKVSALTSYFGSATHVCVCVCLCLCLCLCDRHIKHPHSIYFGGKLSIIKLKKWSIHMLIENNTFINLTVTFASDNNADCKNVNDNHVHYNLSTIWKRKETINQISRGLNFVWPEMRSI